MGYEFGRPLSAAPSKAKVVVACAFFLLAIAMAVYVGLWVMVVGGIVQIVTGIAADPAPDAAMIAWGVVRVLFCQLGAFAAGIVPYLLGLFTLQD